MTDDISSLIRRNTCGMLKTLTQLCQRTEPEGSIIKILVPMRIRYLDPLTSGGDFAEASHSLSFA